MTTATVDFDYSMSDPATYQGAVSQRASRQRTLSTSGMFRYADLNNIAMLCPILDSLEEELDITIWVTAPAEDVAHTPASIRRAANIDTASAAVVLAQRIYFTHPPDQARLRDDTQSFPAVRNRQLENDDNYPDWTLSHGVIAGKIAPHVVTLPWWYANDDHTPEQLEQIHSALRDAITLSLSPDLESQIADVERNALTERIESLIANRSTLQINELRAQVPILVNQLAEYEQRLARDQRRLEEIKAQLSGLEELQIADTDLGATAASEIRRTSELPDVRDISVGARNDELHVHTNMLPLANIDDDSMDIPNGGEYRLTITFGPSPSLRVRNLTRRLGSYDHPHVSDGQFCLGDQRQLLDALIARSEISAAVSLCTDLLKQVNPADTYTSEWAAWFQLDEGELTDV